jgi:hypothetical protein
MRAALCAVAALAVLLVLHLGGPEIAHPVAGDTVAAAGDVPGPCPQCPSELPAAACPASACTPATTTAYPELGAVKATPPRLAAPPTAPTSRCERPDPPPPKVRAA